MIQRPSGAYLEQESSAQIPAGVRQAAGTSAGESFMQTPWHKEGARENVGASHACPQGGATAQQ